MKIGQNSCTKSKKSFRSEMKMPVVNMRNIIEAYAPFFFKTNNNGMRNTNKYLFRPHVSTRMKCSNKEPVAKPKINAMKGENDFALLNSMIIASCSGLLQKQQLRSLVV